MNKKNYSKAKLNIGFSLLGSIVNLFCGLVIPGMMLRAFGSEAYGAANSIKQFLSFITLFEGGVVSVARSALYKPLSARDRDGVDAIMGEIRHFFRIIGLIFIAYVLVLAASYKSLSHFQGYDWISTVLLVLVISVSTVADYFIGISCKILLDADRKNYVVSVINTAATMLNAVVSILLLQMGFGLIAVKFFSGLVYALKPVLLWLYVKKHYRIRPGAERDPNALSQKWVGLGQHLAFCLHTNVDVAVLTLLSNLKELAVYSIYAMVATQIQDITTAFTSGMEALFGDLLAKQKQKELLKKFGMYETMISSVAVWFASVALVMIVPFVELYTRGVNDVQYSRPLFAVLMMLCALTYLLRLPYHAMVIASGTFRPTRVGAYGEVAINLVLSVVLVARFGLVGVAAGTLAGTMFRLVYYALYVSKNVLGRSVKEFIFRLGLDAVQMILIAVAGEAFVHGLALSNYLYWACAAAVVAVGAALVVSAANLLFHKAEFKAAFYKLISREERSGSGKRIDGHEQDL